MFAATTKDPWDSWGHWECAVWSQIGNWCDESIVVYDRPYVQAQVYDPSAQNAFSGSAVDDSLAFLTWQQDSPSDGTWTEDGQHYIEYDHYYSTEWGTWLSCISFSFMAAFSTSVNVTGGGSPPCDPAVTALINDYASCAAGTYPSSPGNGCTINLGPLVCADFTQTRSNSMYSAAQLGNWAQTGVNWGLVNDNLVSGPADYGLVWALETMQWTLDLHFPNFATPYPLNSSYRTPQRNASIVPAGAAASYHMSGNAADIGNPSCNPLGSRQNCNPDVWQTMDDLAHEFFLTDYFEPIGGPCLDDCYHFDYRYRGGDYQ
jgi:Peptidase M15